MPSHVGARVHILLIEPDDQTAREYTRAFGKRGWVVEYAPTFTKSLDLLRQSSYDIALIEMLLPDTLGTDAWSSIRRLQPHILGILTTSSRSLLASVNPAEEGILAYLLKPLDLVSVSNKISQTIKPDSENLSTRRLRKKLVQFYELLLALNHSSDTKHLLTLALPLIHNLFNAETTIILMLAPDGSQWSERYYLHASPSAGQQSIQNQEQIESLVWSAVQSAQTSVPPNRAQNKMRMGTLHVQDARPGKLLVAPLWGAVRDHGALAILNHQDSPRFPSRLQLELVRNAAQALIMALEKAAWTQSLNRDSILDPETKLHTSTFFEQFVRFETTRQDRYQHPYSIVSIHLDGDCAAQFPRDHFLQFVDLVRANVRASDLIALKNDNELDLLLPETDHKGAKQMAKRLGQIVTERSAQEGWTLQAHIHPVLRNHRVLHSSKSKSH